MSKLEEIYKTDNAWHKRHQEIMYLIGEYEKFLLSAHATGLPLYKVVSGIEALYGDI